MGKAEFAAVVSGDGKKFDLQWGGITGPLESLATWAKGFGKQSLTAMVLKQSIRWQTKQATQEAWEALGDFGNALDVTLKSYVQQGGLQKDAAARLASTLVFDSANPPPSPYQNTFIHPSERRVQYAMSALEDASKQMMPVRSLGEHISNYPAGRDVLLQHASNTWEKIDKVRALVLASIKNWNKEGKEIDEVHAWELLAPEALQLAKRFMLMADHPWSRTLAYGKEGTIFYHALRNEAWMKEELNKTKGLFGGRQLTVDAFQTTTNEQEVAYWMTKVKDLETIRQSGIVEAIKKDLKAWKEPFGVAVALIKSGKVDSLTLWLDHVAEKQLTEGGKLNINTQHPEFGSRTLMDGVLEFAPIENKKELVKKLKERGAAMDSLNRTSQSDYSLLMNNMSVTSVKDAAEWVKWVKINTLTPKSTFDKNGDKDAIVALKSGKIEWAAALLALRKNDAEPMTIDGKDWSEVWQNFKADHPATVQEWSRVAKDTVNVLNAATSVNTQSLIEKQPAQFWNEIDNQLNLVGSAAEAKPRKPKP